MQPPEKINTKEALNYLDKNYNIFQTTRFNHTRRLKNVVIFIQTILSFALSRKIINIYKGALLVRMLAFEKITRSFD